MVVGFVLLMTVISVVAGAQEYGARGIGMMLFGWALMLGVIYVILKILHKFIKW